MIRGEKRKAKRFKSTMFIQYERLLEDEKLSLPVTVPARNISMLGVSFYAAEKMNLHSKLRLTFYVDKEKITFVAQVMRIEISKDAPFAFIIVAWVKDIDQENKTRFQNFMNKVDIYKVLSMINMKDVVDIHFVAGYPPIIKKIGELTITESETLGEDILRTLLLNTLDEDRYERFMTEKEINFVFVYTQNKRFRVNLHMQRGKTEGVFRFIPQKISLPHELGLPKALEALLLNNKKGLLLVAGRTGAGKTTTLSSLVELLNQKRKGIVVSIEKPIEYIHTNNKCIIKQREVGRDTLSFSNAAKNALRQSPDILVIGEMLDFETMEVAVTAAETGMLVLTSIHAADTSQALDRVVSFFPADLQKHILYRLSLTLRAVITQDLIPRKDGKGLLVAAEVLIVNDAMKRIVREGDWKQIPNVIQTGREIGMQSMRFSLEEYFNKGMINLEYLKDYI